MEFIYTAERLGIFTDPRQKAMARHTLKVMNAWGAINNFSKIFGQTAGQDTTLRPNT